MSTASQVSAAVGDYPPFPWSGYVHGPHWTGSFANWTPIQTTGPGGTGKPCGWCSGGSGQVYHIGACPRVRSIEYYPDGAVKRVEFQRG